MSSSGCCPSSASPSPSSPSSSSASSSYRFDCLFLRRFLSLFLNIMMKGPSTPLLFLFLLFLSFLEQLVIYNVGLISSAYYTILGDKDLDTFWSHTFKSLLLVGSVAVVKSSKDYTATALYLSWRESLTQKLHSLYFFGINYYKVNVLDSYSNQERVGEDQGQWQGEEKIDNPDQRITQDVDKMCDQLSQVVPQIIISPFIICYYSYVCYKTTGYVGPLGCFIFFLVSTLINKWLMSPIVNLVYQQEKAEGYFRFQHLHVRTNSEAIAFMDGAHLENKIADEKLRRLIDTQERLILRKYPLGMAVNFANYLGSIVSFMALAVPLFAGHYDNLSPTELSGLISKNAFVTIYLIFAFTQLVDLSEQFTVIAGTTHRICQLVETLVSKCNEHHAAALAYDKDFQEFADGGDEDSLAFNSSELIFYELRKVSVNSPKSVASFSSSAPNVLISDLTLKIAQGNNILVSGASGCGKTSILRVLKGLWKQNAGHVRRFMPTHVNKLVLFLPQKPVLTSGSLRQQVVYPEEAPALASTSTSYTSLVSEDGTTREIKRLLKLVGLSYLLDRVDGDIDREVGWNWYDALSPGEMQRIGFARLFYHRPLLAVLDEATSAVALDMEEIFYKELLRLNVTLFTCGHRESLKKYHDLIVSINKPSLWSLEKIIN